MRELSATVPAVASCLLWLPIQPPSQNDSRTGRAQLPEHNRPALPYPAMQMTLGRAT